MSDEMFNEAVTALKAGQRLRAKDLLTRLIKVEQGNADYWLWMSAAVDTEKEQLYCLQNALKADPNSVPARRGLVVLGGLRPEAAGLPPAHELEDLPVRLPEIGQGGGLGGVLGRRRNVQRLALALLGLVTVVVLTTAFLATFKLGPFKPVQNFVVVTSTPPPTNPPPTRAATALPSGACTIPAEPDPATPLAAYLCLTQTATPVPIATSNLREEDYGTIKLAYANRNWSRILDRATAVTTNVNLAQSAEVFFYVAEAYRHTGNLAEALVQYGAALEINASYAPAYWGKALVEVAQDKRREAQADFASALKADTAFAPAYLDRAALAGADGDWAAAVTDLEAARLAAPANALVQASLALAYLQSEQLAEGAAAADGALALDPGLALGYFARGLAALAEGNAAAGQADLSRSYKYLLTLDHPLPAQWQAFVLAGAARGQQAVGDDATALTLLTQSIGLYDQDAPALALRAGLYQQAERYEAAQADYEAAIALYKRAAPNDAALPGLYVGLGQTLLALSQPEAAVTAFAAALKLTPADPAASLGYGQALFQTGALDKALAALDTAVAAKDTQAAALFWRAQVYGALNRTAEQVADLRALQGLLRAGDLLRVTAQAQLTAIGPLPTETPGPTATVTRTSTRTATPSATSTPTFTPTATASATAPRTSTASATASVTATSKTSTPLTTSPSATRTPPRIATATATARPTRTATP
jgi:tetratricopeptide (TPR) repeat protein